MIDFHRFEVRRLLRPIQRHAEPLLKYRAALMEWWQPVAVVLRPAAALAALGDS